MLNSSRPKQSPDLAVGVIGAVQRSVHNSNGLQSRSDLEEGGMARSAVEVIVIRHPAKFDSVAVTALASVGRAVGELF